VTRGDRNRGRFDDRNGDRRATGTARAIASADRGSASARTGVACEVTGMAGTQFRVGRMPHPAG